ncbi:hypothetical protein CMV30_07015 [Nibricoccus aquaticus]|uniref:Uncharacterized protein n=1 Tax=Nibricoccus aquaticus TaxID=2576891 RepID=A0A290Q5L1_9BACT|nr:hypothetical protein CMV30_07015 [Nibricoccus aquaticus]
MDGPARIRIATSIPTPAATAAVMILARSVPSKRNGWLHNAYASPVPSPHHIPSRLECNVGRRHNESHTAVAPVLSPTSNAATSTTASECATSVTNAPAAHPANPPTSCQRPRDAENIRAASTHPPTPPAPSTPSTSRIPPFPTTVCANSTNAKPANIRK